MKHISDPKAGAAIIALPNAHMHKVSSHQDLTHDVWTWVTFDTITAGFVDGHEDLANNKIEVPVTGWYQVEAQCWFVNTHDFINVQLAVWKTASVLLWGHGLTHEDSETGGVPVTIHLSDIIKLDQYQEIKLKAIQWGPDDLIQVYGINSSQTYLGIQRVR